MNFDPIYVVNLLLCLIILILGILGFAKHKSKTALLIGVAFGLFGLSHLATILNLKVTLEWWLVGIRTIAYLLVLAGVAVIVSKKKKIKQALPKIPQE